MADFNVIADVSDTLRSVLTAAFSTLPAAPTAEIHDLQGDIPGTPARMTLFLFEVVEDATLRNRHPSRGVNPPNLTIQRSPIPLILRYLLTPWGGDRRTEQILLGRAMQVLHDGAILSGSQLLGGLAGTSDAIKVKLAPLELEERTRIWNAVNKPYRISLSYDVRVINIDSENSQERAPVRSRNLLPAVGGVNQ